MGTISRENMGTKSTFEPTGGGSSAKKPIEKKEPEQPKKELTTIIYINDNISMIIYQ